MALRPLPVRAPAPRILPPIGTPAWARVLRGELPWTVIHSDALTTLRRLPSDSVDAIVSDPPAGIGFMGQDWDDYRRAHNPADVGRASVFGRTSRVAPEVGRARDGFISMLIPIMAEVLRVAKPGAHALVWALPRTSHWTATALDEAGWEIRDRVSHVFGTGFPKSLNLGEGLGTALKPAVEDWWLCRKPLIGTVERNVNAHGTGALNIDACRITMESASGWKSSNRAAIAGKDGGRWPANFVISCCGEEPHLDGCPSAELDQQSGLRTSGSRAAGVRKGMGFHNAAGDGGPAIEASSGGASRFFYCAKPSRAERDAGLAAFPVRSGGEATGRIDGSLGTQSPRAGAGRTGGARNIHPTTKSVTLMRYLTKLITPPGGVVLDPFTGSGTTGIACVAEGFRFIGTEQEQQYVDIARARIDHAIKQEQSK